MKKLYFIILIGMMSFSIDLHSQDSISKKEIAHSFPEIKGYVGIVHPIYTWSEDGNQQNFKYYYMVGNPWGINIWKTKKFGISFEFTPMIRSDSKLTKMTNLVFHPGVLYRLGHDFTLIGRLAFETSGRYGFTPIISKVLIRGKNSNFFTSLVLPFRFGNDHAMSFATAIQFGIGF